MLDMITIDMHNKIDNRCWKQIFSEGGRSKPKKRLIKVLSKRCKVHIYSKAETL